MPEPPHGREIDPSEIEPVCVPTYELEIELRGRPKPLLSLSFTPGMTFPARTWQWLRFWLSKRRQA